MKNKECIDLPTPVSACRISGKTDYMMEDFVQYYYMRLYLNKKIKKLKKFLSKNYVPNEILEKLNIKEIVIIEKEIILRLREGIL